MTNDPHITHGLHKSDQYEARFVGDQKWIRTPMFCGQAACEWLCELIEASGLHEVEYRNEKSSDTGMHTVQLRMRPIARCIGISEEDHEPYDHANARQDTP
jgi:hypothetical protein